MDIATEPFTVDSSLKHADALWRLLGRPVMVFEKLTHGRHRYVVSMHQGPRRRGRLRKLLTRRTGPTLFKALARALEGRRQAVFDPKPAPSARYSGGS